MRSEEVPLQPLLPSGHQGIDRRALAASLALGQHVVLLLLLLLLPSAFGDAQFACVVSGALPRLHATSKVRGHQL